jgi:DNA-binding transcriptional ArsR family regulator
MTPPGEDNTNAVFGALADSTRRQLLLEIAQRPALTATQLATELPISRQAVLKHLNALSDAGLVQRQRRGREVQYRATPEPLSGAVSWMAEVGGQWDQRLGALTRTLAGGSGAAGATAEPRARAQRGEMPR